MASSSKGVKLCKGCRAPFCSTCASSHTSSDEEYSSHKIIDNPSSEKGECIGCILSNAAQKQHIFLKTCIALSHEKGRKDYETFHSNGADPDSPSSFMYPVYESRKKVKNTSSTTAVQVASSMINSTTFNAFKSSSQYLEVIAADLTGFHISIMIPRFTIHLVVDSISTFRS